MKTIIASDVNKRDGIGVEIYLDNEIVMEIFRDDTLKTRTVTLFNQDVSLELVEAAIKEFKSKIPWEFVNYENLQ